LISGALAGLSVPLPDFTELDLNPLNTFKEPSLRLDLRQRSGPIMIMVDYEIAQADVPEFLAAMNARRRIRIRDGAQQWTLLRDLENPDFWTETYHVPTWVEYVRHHERRTQADAESYQRLLKLHRGREKPKVHRMIERQAVSLKDDTPLKDPNNTVPE
ncbi:MFS transporter, partial [Marivita sp.]|uniref:MFS transporter n=1 Tax=Marivita sp. TaxID=2003365 RepID=UPI0025C3EC06